jgi:hypothetical protein
VWLKNQTDGELDDAKLVEGDYLILLQHYSFRCVNNQVKFDLALEDISAALTRPISLRVDGRTERLQKTGASRGKRTQYDET